jgi:hypothetical protein
MEVCPNTTCAPSPATPVVGTAFVGALVRHQRGNYVFVHRQADGPDGSFVLSEPGTYQVLIAGLPLDAQRTLTPGAHVSFGGSTQASGQGTITVTMVVSAAGAGATNTVAVK